MPFDPLELKIFPKGINLLPPGDQVAEGDCLELTGFWPGSVGRLEQARGWVKKNVGTGANGLNSLAESDGNLFFSDGSILFEGVEDGSTVASIDTGYDGYPLGMCSFQHVLWVMNRAKQQRVGTGPNAGLGVSAWGSADATPGALTGVMAAGGSLEDGNHTYFVTFVDAFGYESNPSPGIVLAAPSEPVPGFNDGTVSLTLGSTAVTLTPNLTSGWPQSISGQQFLVPSEYPTINPPQPSPYTITWNSATTGTLSVAWAGLTGSYSYQIYSLPNSGKATITRPAAGSGPTPMGWNLYHQSPGINGPYQVNLNGALVYSGSPTDPNQTSATTYVDFGDVAHGQDDNTLLAADLLMEANHDAPPAARVMAAKTYNGRLVVANSAQNPNRVWWTNPLEPNYFPGSSNPQAGNWADIGDDPNDGVLVISVRKGMLIIYRQKSIWQIQGDLGDPSSVISPLIPNMGIAGPRAVVGTSNGDLAVVRQGIDLGLYRVTDWEQRIGAKIEPILNGLGAECYLPISTAGGNTAVATCALGYKLGRLWFSYPDGTNTYPNRTLICDIEQDQFSISVAGRWFSRVGGFGAYLHGSLFFLGAGSTTVYSLEDGTNGEDGTATSLAYQSAYVDCGNPDHEKTFADLVIPHHTGGPSLGVYIKRNKDSDSFQLASINSALTGPDGNPIAARQVIPMLYPAGHMTNGVPDAGQPIEGFNISVRIQGNGTLAYPGAFIDTPILLHYYLKPRRVSQWDSGPTDHGMTGVKVVDAIEIDADCTFTGTFFLQSDIPGGTMAERTVGGTGIVVQATSGRQVQRLILPAPIAGRILRYQIFWQFNAPGLMALVYRVRLRLYPAGEFVDGAFAGDSWYTIPIAPGE